MPVIPALRRLRQEDHEFEANLSYIARPCLKTKQEHITTVTIMMMMIMASDNYCIRITPQTFHFNYF
jgi:hypothetical protein